MLVEDIYHADVISPNLVARPILLYCFRVASIGLSLRALSKRFDEALRRTLSGRRAKSDMMYDRKASVTAEISEESPAAQSGSRISGLFPIAVHGGAQPGCRNIPPRYRLGFHWRRKGTIENM